MNLAKITRYLQQAVIPVSCVAQAILVSRLHNKDAGSQTSDSLMKAVNVCDKFLTGAQGTQAELDVLKSQVRLTLAQKVCCECECIQVVASLLAIMAGPCKHTTLASKHVLWLETGCGEAARTQTSSRTCGNCCCEADSIQIFRAALSRLYRMPCFLLQT